MLELVSSPRDPPDPLPFQSATVKRIWQTSLMGVMSSLGSVSARKELSDLDVISVKEDI